MLLLCDVGNTHMVWGVVDDSFSLIHQWRMSTHPIKTPDEIQLQLKNFLLDKKIAWSSVHQAVISSVVPTVSAVLQQVFSQKTFLKINHDWPFSFKIKPNPPQQVGADRLVNAEAVVQEYKAPAIIVDSGTATTICAVSKQSEYLGGAILPGIELSMQALAQRTAKLFPIDLNQIPEKAIGSNTNDALRSGILFGYASMVDAMIEKFKLEMKEPNALVIATGGVSQYLKNLCENIDICDSDLTLKGMIKLTVAYQDQAK